MSKAQFLQVLNTTPEHRLRMLLNLFQHTWLENQGKHRGAPVYDEKVMGCIELGVVFKCCQLAADIIGLEASELMPGIKMIESHVVAELFLEYQSEGELIISL